MADEVHLGDRAEKVTDLVKVTGEQRAALLEVCKVWADAYGYGPAVTAGIMIQVGQKLADLIFAQGEAGPLKVVRVPHPPQEPN